MYLDFIKADYKGKSPEDIELYIARDKRHLGKIVQSHISEEIEEIVDRWYELDDIGVIDEEGIFLNLLKESEELFSFAYYVGGISLIGVAAEELSKRLCSKNNVEDIDLTQYKRINLLKSKGIIINSVQNELHFIRKIRNDYIHANTADLYEDLDELKQKCYLSIKSFKTILNNTLKVDEIDYSKVVEKLISNQNINFTDFKYRYRNILKKEEIDLQIDVKYATQVTTSIFKLCEIDLAFNEISLLDLNNGLLAIIDLTLPQAKEIEELRKEKET